MIHVGKVSHTKLPVFLIHTHSPKPANIASRRKINFKVEFQGI